MRRVDATQRLRAVHATRSPDELVRSLDDPSPEVVRAAIARLVDLEGQRAAGPLRARLFDVDLSLVADVAGALRRIGDRGAVEVAIKALRDGRYSRRLAAVRALGERGHGRSRSSFLRSGHMVPSASPRGPYTAARTCIGSGLRACALLPVRSPVALVTQPLRSGHLLVDPRSPHADPLSSATSSCELGNATAGEAKADRLQTKPDSRRAEHPPVTPRLSPTAKTVHGASANDGRCKGSTIRERRSGGTNADRGASGSGDMLVRHPKEGAATPTDPLSQIANPSPRPPLSDGGAPRNRPNPARARARL